ncbi:hypothetical protein FSP39_013407 [Pinctada imbricata]|uniref:Fucosyltransferase n=1 Tax=Pinctada imbricata TaxID=66713 RepID=A0AA89BTV9_PINIB|nr:hypothetical protein FSP39_013407 [Pinctada imbricata]
MEYYIYSSVMVFMILLGFSNSFVGGSKQRPLILWWYSGIYPHDGDEVNLVKCGKVKCLSSASRRYLADSRTRVIIFYGSRLSPRDLPLPRADHHQWALFHEESPMNNYILSHGEFMELFNHTATFSRMSDYPITTHSIYSLRYLTERMPTPLETKNRKIKNENLAPILYIQSHCNVASDRDNYVRELMKYIKVDSYGKCLHDKDLPLEMTDPMTSFQSESFYDFISQYKFHLAFENAICGDYFTEKITRPLHVGSIPIYHGSPTIRDWMPNNRTIILVNDYKSPKYLAQYINYLNDKDDEYEKYLEYKNPGGVTNQRLLNTLMTRDWGTQDEKMYKYNDEDKDTYFAGFECHLCRTLWESETEESSVPRKYIANSSHMDCPNPYPSVGDRQRKLPYDYWGPMNYQQVYEDDKIRASAVRKMLQMKETDSNKFWDYYQELLEERQLHRVNDEL